MFVQYNRDLADFAEQGTQFGGQPYRVFLRGDQFNAGKERAEIKILKHGRQRRRRAVGFRAAEQVGKFFHIFDGELCGGSKQIQIQYSVRIGDFSLRFRSVGGKNAEFRICLHIVGKTDLALQRNAYRHIADKQIETAR